MQPAAYSLQPRVVQRLADSEGLIWSSRRAGSEVHRGAIEGLNSRRTGAAATDGVIHLAFNNISETTDFAASLQADPHAAETIGTALEGSGSRS